MASTRSGRSGNATTDHEEIRRWVEERGGCPARVKGTGKGDDPGILRIDYPGFSGRRTLEPVEWDDFFEWMDANNLAFLYQDKPDSRFSKLVSRDTAAARERGESGHNGAGRSGRRAASSSARATGTRKTSKRATGGRATRATKSTSASARKKAAPAGIRKAAKRTSVRAGTRRKKTAAKSTARKAGTARAR